MSLSATTTVVPTVEGDPRREPIVRVRRASVHWLMGSRAREAVLGPPAPDWLGLERDPRASLVKSGHLRRTWRVTLSEGTVFATVFEGGGSLLGRLSRWVGMGTAKREWRASRAAERRGVPAVRSLALGLGGQRRGGEVLLSKGLPDAATLSHAWEHAAEHRATALSLIEAVARLFASAHNRGFVHRDAHPGNILIQPTSDGGCKALFVDLHGAYFAGNLPSRRRVARALAQLDHYFQRHASRSQRWRFLQSYVSLRRSFFVRGERRTFYGELLSSIAAARTAHAAALARQRDRRIRGNGKYFATFALGHGWKGTFVLQLERRHAFPETGIPDRSEEDWRNLVQLVLNGQRRHDDTLVGHALRLERDTPIGMGARLLWSVTGSPQRQEFIRSHRLRHRDIASELILGCLEHRSPVGLIDETVLVRPTPSGECQTDDSH